MESNLNYLAISGGKTVLVTYRHIHSSRLFANQAKLFRKLAMSSLVSNCFEMPAALCSFRNKFIFSTFGDIFPTFHFFWRRRLTTG